MGMIVLKAMFWFVVFGLIWGLIKGFFSGSLNLVHMVADKVDAAREEAAYQPIRAAKMKASDDSLLAATARANAWIQQHDAEKAKREAA
ncbi:MAG: hypothetical protein ACRCUF_20740 [Aeromonas sobria]